MTSTIETEEALADLGSLVVEMARKNAAHLMVFITAVNLGAHRHLNIWLKEIHRQSVAGMRTPDNGLPSRMIKARRLICTEKEFQAMRERSIPRGSDLKKPHNIAV